MNTTAEDRDKLDDLVGRGATITLCRGRGEHPVAVAGWAPDGLAYITMWPSDQHHSHIERADRVEWASNGGCNLWLDGALVATVWPFEPGDAERYGWAEWQQAKEEESMADFLECVLRGLVKG